MEVTFIHKQKMCHQYSSVCHNQSYAIICYYLGEYLIVVLENNLMLTTITEA